MERKRKIKDGHIVVKNPLFQELPKHEVTIKSGRTLYRFTGSYDGERSLPHKVLRLMEMMLLHLLLVVICFESPNTLIVFFIYDIMP